MLSPHPDDAAWLQQTALQLLDEHRALGRRPLDIHHALRRSLLESLLLRLANSPGIAPIGTATAGTGRADTYGRFLDALELHFRELHQAADYAELLGCSVRTLSRAARDATGKGVRELIDERRLLEARRLLGGARWDARAVAVTSASPIPRTSAASSATAPVSPRPPSRPARPRPSPLLSLVDDLGGSGWSQSTASMVTSTVPSYFFEGIGPRVDFAEDDDAGAAGMDGPSWS